ncbi:hypothetical protein CDD83_2617 [Cordyceps sp. RAO-2017]|nr:hypothetical protein CDD83_2617 [Cordyceps sp. RAO-2017]
MREKKKRGKASRKDLAERAAAAAAAAAVNTTKHHYHYQARCKPQTPSERSDASKGRSRATSLPSDYSDGTGDHQNGPPRLHQQSTDDAASQRLRAVHVAVPVQSHAHAPGGYIAIPPDFDRQSLHIDVPDSPPDYVACTAADPALSLGPVPQGHAGFGNGPAFVMGGGDSLNTYPMVSMASSPGWGMHISPSPPPGQFRMLSPCPDPDTARVHLRYPVLEPLVAHLGNVALPVSLACDLLDLYFSSPLSDMLHPLSPLVLGFVFRKRSILHPTRPRTCQPALLASMLWVAAQTSDAALLTSSPPARPVVCQRLLDLTLRLLKPLIHNPAEAACSTADAALAALSLGAAVPGAAGMDALAVECGALGAAAQLDDVVTYMHIATVASASEYKGASLRWWNAAWSLARELRLGRELSLTQSRPSQEQGVKGDIADSPENGPGAGGEEGREERRRVWWLLYAVDRHLALCYNRPLFLLDVECEGLLHPMDDRAWQRGDFRCRYEAGPGPDPDLPVDGCRFACRGHSIFGYFLPLMTILGEIVDLHHAQNHPSAGLGLGGARDGDERAQEIRRHLDAYEQSLIRLEERCFWSLSDCSASGEQQGGDHGGDTRGSAGARSRSGSPSTRTVGAKGSKRMAQDEMQARIVLAYGTHVMHVLHILLAGRWDPISLLDDGDSWVSSESFLKAASHAISAADAIGQILEYDPGLELMPFFFGIYLLQGSLLLLLIADKLQLEASPSVVRACETIVRAHEACVVTLSTEYQRNFSKVMRSALAAVRGRVPGDGGEQRQRWRELLGLYRWTGDGTGLAL